MNSLELFTGGGGLALGIAQATFDHVALVERDRDSCDTLRLNKERDLPKVRDWPVHQMDVRDFDYSTVHSPIDLLAGGVPCQPFSIGGKHKGYKDSRDMFPEFIKAVRQLRPKAFLVENVKGLLRQSFADYFEYVVLRLQHPTMSPGPDVTWRQHRAELERLHTAGRKTDLDYNVVFQLLNAADFGVPQRRERVFIVGFRSDLGVQWSFPAPTHSQEALQHDQWISKDYWERHRVPTRKRPAVDDKFYRFLARFRGAISPELGKPWRTVRDAIGDLPGLKPGETDARDPNHFANPGARSYAGHTGSKLDEPAKTLKAGDHGVPGEKTRSTSATAWCAISRCARRRDCTPFPMNTGSLALGPSACDKLETLFQCRWRASLRVIFAPSFHSSVESSSDSGRFGKPAFDGNCSFQLLTRSVPGRPRPGTLLPKPVLFHSGL